MTQIPPQPQTAGPAADADEQATSSGAGETNAIRAMDTHPGSPGATEVATVGSAPLADNPPAPAPAQGHPAPPGEPAEGGDQTERLRDAVVRELVLNDIAYRRRDGEVPTAEEYLSRFPDLDP